MGSVNGKVFSVMGPNNYQINSLGIFSGIWSGQELQEIIHWEFFPVGNAWGDNGKYFPDWLKSVIVSVILQK